MEADSQVPPIPISTKFQLASTASRPTSGVSELEPLVPLENLPALEFVRDDSSSLDVQYLELISRFQSLVKKPQDWAYASSPENNVFPSLQTALVDLRVWAYDLSSDSDFFLESLRNLSSSACDLNKRLQQTIGNIGQILGLIEGEIDKMDRNKSRIQSSEKLLNQCQMICNLVEILKTLKPSIRKEMAASNSRERTTSTARTKARQPPSVLSFDGGGVKSYASLLVLQRLMKYVTDEWATQANKSSERTITKPCDVFDFIFGSSSGGLLAIMLGRLQMTVEECMERFLAHSDMIVAHPSLTTKFLGPFSTSKFGGEKIQQATRRLVGDFDPTPTHDKWKRNVFGDTDSRCKTGVFATSAPKTTSYMFRTYDCEPSASGSPEQTPLNPGPATMCQIWEVARATTAAPTYFPPVHIEDDVFIDGGLTANNPTQEALREVAYLYGNKLSGTCMVSIGSGFSRDPILPAPRLGKKTGFHSLKDTFRILRAAATQTETTNSDVLFEASLNVGLTYFRLNPEYDRQIALDEWDKSRRTQAEIERSTENYLDNAKAKESLRQCASTLVSKLSRKVDFYARNEHFNVPRPPNSLFTGRVEELHEMKRLLKISKIEQVGPNRVLVITGLGGQGKSEICIKLAHDMREEFWGIFWVDVGTPTLAENGFTAIASKLGSTVQNVHNAVQVLANTKEKWLLILDNADDPDNDYQQFLPPGQYGTVIITSRMYDCRQYNTIGAITLEALSNSELTELLMKASRLPRSQDESYIPEAKNIVNALGHHTLAVIQAGAFIAAGHCTLDEYVKLLQQHRQRMLKYEPRQAVSRYGNIYATFDTVTPVLNNKSEQGTDASCLLGILSILHSSDVPFQIFEDAWNGLHRIREIQRASTQPAVSLTQWHISRLPPFLVAEQSGSPKWDPYRLNEASHLLESLALVTRVNGGLAMHPLVHAWARDRQDGEQKAQSWLTSGCVIALSNYESSLWIVNQRRLQEHLHSFLAVDMATAFSRGPEPMILAMFLECGRILLQMRDDSRLSLLLEEVFRESHNDSETPSPALRPLYDLAARNMMNNGRWKEAEKIFAQIQEMSSRILERDHPDTLASQTNLASTFRNQGRLKEAEALEVQVLETSKRVLGEEHPDTLTSMAHLASTYNNQGRWKEAEELEIQVIKTSKKVLGEEHPSTLTSIANLASTYSNQGRWKEAEELKVQVIETFRRVLGEEHPSTLTRMANLASTYKDQSRWKEAEELEVQVMETSSRVLGEEHPSTLTSMANLASTYKNQGRWERAEELEVQVMETSSRVLGEEHPSTLTSMANLASTYKNQGRWERAEELEVQVMETSSRVLGEEHPSTLTSMANLASTYKDQGRWGGAEELEVQVMETSSRVLGEEHPSTLTSMVNLASTYKDQGRWKEAEELEVQVMETSSRVLGEEHPSTLTSMKNLAFTWKSQGRDLDALRLMRECFWLRKQKLGADHPDSVSSLDALNEWESVSLATDF